MTSQCISARVDMNVYDNGRDFLDAGVLPLEDMLGETALAKMMWVLANGRSAEERKGMMRANLAGEIHGEVATEQTDMSLPLTRPSAG